MAVARLGYEIDSSGAVVAEQNLDDMAAAAKRAEVGSKRLTGGAGAAGKAISGVTFNARMLVPQLSQIGQQFTATGQLGQAVAVQAADIGLAFGVVGTVIGTVAGVALPVLISAFSDAEEETRKYSEVLGDAKSALDDYVAASKLANIATGELGDKFFEVTPGATDFANAIKEIANREAMARIQEAVDLVSLFGREAGQTADSVRGDTAALAALFDVNVGFAGWGEEARDARDRAREMTEAFAMSQIELENTNGDLQAQSQILRRMLQQATDLANETDGISAAEDELLTRIARALELVELRISATKREQAEAQTLATLLEGVGNAASGSLTALESLEDPVRRAANAAADFFTNMFNASKVQAGIIAAAEARGGGRGGDPRQFGLDDTALNLLRMGGEFITSPDGRTGGGAGGDGALDALVSELQTEREVIEAWRAEGLELLNNANAAELAALGGHNEAKLRLEKEYQERLQGIQDQSAGQTLDVYSGLFGNMAALAKAGGEKTFKVWKAFSIAQATIDSYRAYTQVLADPFFIGRPFLRAIAAGSVLASGLAQVASIQSTSLGGGGGSSGTSATAGVTATGATAPQQTRAIISLQGGRSRFTVEEINDITRQLQEQSDDGVIIEGFTRA